MKKINKRITPPLISKLSACEIFVFGSNIRGQHHGGAARIANIKFGAEWGVGDGPTGQCYAIPTMFKSIDEIKPYVRRFIEYAKQHPMNRFLLTPVGCGIAGYKHHEIAPLFTKCLKMTNVTLPEEWVACIIAENDIKKCQTYGSAPRPQVADEEILKRLCEKYTYEIGAGINSNLPNLMIRCLNEKNQFEYARFGDFFFHGEDLYIWDLNDKWESEHNPDIVMEHFHDECIGRGYIRKLRFAGVKTEFKDTNRMFIYTGDIIRIEQRSMPSLTFALGTHSDSYGNGEYLFILGDDDMRLVECYQKNYNFTRIGTVFMHPTIQEEAKTINELVIQYNKTHNPLQWRK